jgi:hypothetical protein
MHFGHILALSLDVNFHFGALGRFFNVFVHIDRYASAATTIDPHELDVSYDVSDHSAAIATMEPITPWVRSPLALSTSKRTPREMHDSLYTTRRPLGARKPATSAA